MGWGRTLLLGDIGNRLDIEDVEQDVAMLRREISSGFRGQRSLQETVDDLVGENAQLRLIVFALARLLTRKNVLTLEELNAMVAAVDAEDGSVDGKYTGKKLDP